LVQVILLLSLAATQASAATRRRALNESLLNARRSGCVSQGRTEAEALENIREAIIRVKS